MRTFSVVFYVGCRPLNWSCVGVFYFQNNPQIRTQTLLPLLAELDYLNLSNVSAVVQGNHCLVPSWSVLSTLMYR